MGGSPPVGPELPNGNSVAQERLSIERKLTNIGKIGPPPHLLFFGSPTYYFLDRGGRGAPANRCARPVIGEQWAVNPEVDGERKSLHHQQRT